MSYQRMVQSWDGLATWIIRDGKIANTAVGYSRKTGGPLFVVYGANGFRDVCDTVLKDIPQNYEFRDLGQPVLGDDTL